MKSKPREVENQKKQYIFSRGKMNNMWIGKLPVDLTTKELVIIRMTVSTQIRKGLVAT